MGQEDLTKIPNKEDSTSKVKDIELQRDQLKGTLHCLEVTTAASLWTSQRPGKGRNKDGRDKFEVLLYFLII